MARCHSCQGTPCWSLPMGLALADTTRHISESPFLFLSSTCKFNAFSIWTNTHPALGAYNHKVVTTFAVWGKRVKLVDIYFFFSSQISRLEDLFLQQILATSAYSFCEFFFLFSQELSSSNLKAALSGFSVAWLKGQRHYSLALWDHY